ncbi:uncharacterized protein LOC129972059 [Argiope bruennichi]|uniref:uncharacterized protein LOC129972059 n=1 Tax=Argiope bruennichi TaxID=94029 RepID=UPI00249556CB|nr:uncharacterized protein LOC129972059 [Argiope bruennichi]
MDNYSCKRCGNLVTRGEDHTCFRHKKFDYRYSLQRPVESDENHDEVKDKSTENSNEDKQRTSSDSSYFNPLSDVQGIEIQTNEIAYFTASSENVESSYRPVQSLKKDKKDFMDVIEYATRNDLSDINNNVSGTANSTENPDLPPGDNEPKNGKMQVSESVNDEHISSEVHSQVHSKKTKVTTYVKEPHSTKKDDNAVAGPSGVRSYIREIDVQPEENASLMVSSENAESCFRLENDFPAAYNFSPAVIESTGVDEERQRISGITDLIYATGSEKDEMSCQENKWLSLNNDNKYFMDSLECAIRRGHSDRSNISEPRKLIVNPDFLPERNEPENGKIPVSEYVTDEHTSLEIHSNVYSKSENITVNWKEHISSKTYNNAVAGPSGMCPLKKKFPCTLCPKELNEKCNLYVHYRTHTGQKPFIKKLTTSAESSSNTQLKKPFDTSYCNPNPNVKPIVVQSKGNVSFTASSTVESRYRPENGHREGYEKKDNCQKIKW